MLMLHLLLNTTQIYAPRLDESHQTLDNVSRQASELKPSQDILHQIVFVSPGDHEVEVSIATRYLYEMVRDALSDRTLAAAARLHLILPVYQA